MNETGGALRAAVLKYLELGELDGNELSLIRAYLQQWLAGDFRGNGVAELRRRVPMIVTTEQLRAWLADALELEIDPL